MTNVAKIKLFINKKKSYNLYALNGIPLQICQNTEHVSNRIEYLANHHEIKLNQIKDCRYVYTLQSYK